MYRFLILVTFLMVTIYSVLSLPLRMLATPFLFQNARMVQNVFLGYQNHIIYNISNIRPLKYFILIGAIARLFGRLIMLNKLAFSS